MDVALLAALGSCSFLPKFDKPSPGQVFPCRLERALYLLAVKQNPREIGAVTVAVAGID